MLSVLVVIVAGLAGFILGTIYGVHVLADVRSVMADMRSVMAIVRQDISDESQKMRQHVSDTWLKR